MWLKVARPDRWLPTLPLRREVNTDLLRAPAQHAHRTAVLIATASLAWSLAYGYHPSALAGASCRPDARRGDRGHGVTCARPLPAATNRSRVSTSDPLGVPLNSPSTVLARIACPPPPPPPPPTTALTLVRAALADPANHARNQGGIARHVFRISGGSRVKGWSACGCPSSDAYGPRSRHRSSSSSMLSRRIQAT